MKKQQSSKPNVIVFFTDQQRWDTTGVHGNPLDLTPNFDRVAQEGTHLYHSFTCQPVCAPARACFQTGKYATETGCFRNGIPLPAEEKTLADYFKENGYYTGYIGKWHLAAEEPVSEERQGGYDYWLAANGLEHTSEPYQTRVYNNKQEPVDLPGYRVDALTDAAIRFIEKEDKKAHPFFLFLSFLEPHHQNRTDDYPAPTGYSEKYTSRWTPPDLQALSGTAFQQLGGYYGMVKRLDEALGRLMDVLKSLQIEDNTIVLFTSDHGCHFKTRNKEYKRSCHESSVRIPTAVTGPGFVEGGRKKELVSLIDFAPTLLDAAGIDVPDELSGRSFLPLVTNKDIDWKNEVFIQISESQVGRAVRTQRWKYSVSNLSLHPAEHDKASVYQEEFLYDLEADPYELTNLIELKSHREVKERLRERLLDFIRKVEGETPEIRGAAEVESGQRKVLPEEISY
ncbi:sulfatase-like hydrolase/transferase [Gracilibacillus salitolerans]|uniref:Sulfatase-like hydrolase/transferase n=1 Tax=Gracilibacillus salitolerans TaxID=2663022 RepID=A0A5Q2TMF9_9BACI|nr:sulfatase-like hydrolase/transferase [Gracilibacillus salitolerans]QGH35966.1 sulfatase-like hydrolase/transferase [Gracilibacillus salitolerans]